MSEYVYKISEVNLSRAYAMVDGLIQHLHDMDSKAQEKTKLFGKDMWRGSIYHEYYLGLWNVLRHLEGRLEVGDEHENYCYENDEEYVPR